MATAKKTDMNEEKGVTAQAPAPEKDPWEIREPVMVPLLQNSKNQPDYAVSVNGRIFQIQRGVEVLVPRPIARVVRRALKAEMEAQAAYYAAAGIKNNGEI